LHQADSGGAHVGLGQSLIVNNKFAAGANIRLWRLSAMHFECGGPDWSGCNKLVSISDVNKTNGVPGDREYKVDFSYNLVFKHPISNVFHLRNYCTKQKPADTLAHVLLRSGAVKEGDSLQMTGTVLLVKSEKGWISNDQ
jgi:hypothetical protein